MSKGKINIYRDSFLEKEELDRLMNFIRDNPALFLFVSNAQSFGIIQQGASLSIDPAFKIEVGTNANTIKMATDSYALDSNGELIYQRLFDNLEIPTTDETWYWIKISHRYDNYEQGFVDIGVDGTLSGIGTEFTKVLRGISSGFPIKVKFFTQNADGSLSTPTNSGIYEVNSIASDTAAVLTGNFTAESNLRYVVLGTFSIKTSISSITSQGIYSYDSCQVDFIEEEVADTPPVTDFVTNEEFYIARVKTDGATVTVQDKRSNYYFRLNFGDIIVSNKANVDASNIDAPSAALWLTALSVYTKAQIDATVLTLMVKAQNLNDVANKTTARSNLGVYSTAYIDATLLNYALSSSVYTKAEQGNLLRKYVDLGDWDMDADAMYGGDLTWATLGIAFAKVKSVSCFIRSDADVLTTPVYPLNIVTTGSGSAAIGGSLSFGSTGIALNRVTGGLFDSTDFNATSYSRGYVIIDYIA